MERVETVRVTQPVTMDLGGESFGAESEGVPFENRSVIQHIDVETNRVRYTKFQYTLTLRSQEASFTLEQRFSEFNEPVDIELPKAAESASPIDDAYGGYSAGPA